MRESLSLSWETLISQVRSSKFTSSSPPIGVKIQIDDCLIGMEVDTGASVTLMSESTLYGLWPGRSLDSTSIRLCSYAGETIPLLGQCYVNVAYQGRKFVHLPLIIVVQGSGPSLLGRNWLSQIKLDWQAIHQVQCVRDLQDSIG